jgi:hypothetical protein
MRHGASRPGREQAPGLARICGAPSRPLVTADAGGVWDSGLRCGLHLGPRTRLTPGRLEPVAGRHGLHPRRRARWCRVKVEQRDTLLLAGCVGASRRSGTSACGGRIQRHGRGSREEGRRGRKDKVGLSLLFVECGPTGDACKAGRPHDCRIGRCATRGLRTTQPPGEYDHFPKKKLCSL